MNSKLLRILIMSAKYSFLIQLLISVNIMAAAFDGKAQYKSVKETQIQIESRLTSIQEAFDKIQVLTDYSFFYDESILKNRSKIDVRPGDYKVSEILIEISKKTRLKFKQVNNNIGVTPLKKKESHTLEVVLDAKDISGKVNDENGEGLVGVTITIKGTTNGTITDINGNYELKGVPDQSTLVFRFIGFATQSIDVEDRSVINIQMLPDATQLQELVVTGVPVALPKHKLGFSVASVDAQILKNAPATSIGTALAGKVAGLTLQPSTLPGEDPQLLLRGITSLASGINSGNSSPLIIIDGIIIEQDLSQGNLRNGISNLNGASVTSVLSDINLQDVEKIEVLKGASAATLFGSRAANGVIQIFTKRGNNLEQGKTEITVRNELGTQRLYKSRIPERAKAHPFVLTTDGELLLTIEEIDSENAFGEEGTIFAPSVEIDPDGIADNPFKRNTEPIEELFEGTNLITNYISVASRTTNGNYSVSFEHQKNSGGVNLHNGSRRYNFRVNIDQNITDKLSLSTSSLFVKSKVDQRLQRLNEAIYMLPGSKLDGVNQEDDSPYDFNPSPFIEGGGNTGVSSGYFFNPLYFLNNTVNDQNRIRYLGNLNLKYDITDNLIFEGRYSYDTWRAEEFETIPNKFLASRFRGAGQIGVGSIIQSNEAQQSIITSSRLTYVNTFGDFKVRANTFFQYEEATNSGFLARGLGLGLDGIFNFNNVRLTPITIDETTFFRNLFSAKNQLDVLIVTNSTAFAVGGDYKDKYIVDFVIRNDASSLFGNENRNNIFSRVSGAWRVIEDFKIYPFNELKLSASYGTAGTRPLFLDRFSTAPIVNGSADVPTVAPNEKLKPSTTNEVEILLDSRFLDKFNLKASYSAQNNKDQILNVPQSVILTNFEAIRLNAGDFKGHTIELGLDYQVINTKNVGLDISLLYDRSRTELTGYRAQSIRNGRVLWSEDNIGKSLTNFYGSKFARSIDDLPRSEGGLAIYQISTLPDANQLADGDFKVNSEGYLIVASTENTEDERPILIRDEDSEIKRDFVIGNSQADFKLSFISNFSYKNFHFYMLWEHQKGGDVYNLGADLQLTQLSHPILDQSGRPEGERKHIDYYGGFNNDDAGNNDFFVEDGTHTRLREVSISYTVNSSFLEKLNIGALKSIEFSAIGRNLLLFSNYSGFDPVVGGLLTRTDTYRRPLISTVSGAITFKF